jgi:DNA polymerase IV
MTEPRSLHVPQVLHVDMDAFFVSVEELEDPSLKGKAVIVGADPDGRGVVAAASYEARKFGVHSAQPIQQAKRLCPHAVFLRGSHEKYRSYSQKIYGIFNEFTPIVEMMSIDEAYLNLTGCDRLHGSGFRAADQLIRTVKQRTGLNCSVGLSRSHLVSKIASDQAKPHGLLWVMPGHEATFLAPLPIRRMPGIGKVTEPQLHSLGIWTIGDLQQWSREGLSKRFGKYGEWLYMKSRGEDTGAYAYAEEPKSISHETTFDQDTTDREELERTLSYLAQLVARRLRDHALFARTIGLKLRFAPFRTVTRDVSLVEPTHLDSTIYQSVLQLFDRVWKPGEKVRLLGVRASKLEKGVFQQSLMQADIRERMTRLLATADKIRDRFGFDILQLGRSLEPIDDDSDGLEEFDLKPSKPLRRRKRKPRREFLGA